MSEEKAKDSQVTSHTQPSTITAQNQITTSDSKSQVLETPKIYESITPEEESRSKFYESQSLVEATVEAQPEQVPMDIQQQHPQSQKEAIIEEGPKPIQQEATGIIEKTESQLPVLAIARPSREEYQSEPQEIPVSEELKLQLQKIYSADYSHYNSYIAKDKNQIWAGALTLAWKQLEETHLKKESVLLSAHQSISQNFSKCQFDRSLIDQKSIFIKSGFGQQTVKDINAGMAQKFPENSFGPLQVDLGPRDLIAYAYLFKKLMFEVQFQRHEYKRLSFTGTVHEQKLVDSFYVETAKQAKQIQIHRWRGNEDFIVQLKNSSQQDKIYLYKPPRQAKLTVGQVIRAIVYVERQNQNIELEEFRSDIDKFEMPVLDLDYTHSYKQLIGATIQNEGELHGYRFSQVTEGLKFKIDQKGVRVQNFGFMIVNECSVSGPNPKTLHFDRPFWIVMKEDKRHPYLCIHINNI